MAASAGRAPPREPAPNGAAAVRSEAGVDLPSIPPRRSSAAWPRRRAHRGEAPRPSPRRGAEPARLSPGRAFADFLLRGFRRSRFDDGALDLLSRATARGIALGRDRQAPLADDSRAPLGRLGRRCGGLGRRAKRGPPFGSGWRTALCGHRLSCPRRLRAAGLVVSLEHIPRRFGNRLPWRKALPPILKHGDASRKGKRRRLGLFVAAALSRLLDLPPRLAPLPKPHCRSMTKQTIRRSR